MNQLAPRQGIFAIILLVSFCLHLLLLVFSTEKQQYDYQADKGEKIVEQLGKEASVAMANQDRISLSVLANRYQVDKDVAKLVITDQNQQPLVQTGQSQTETGQVIDKPIIQNNQVLGHAVVTMKAVSKGEIVSNQWLFILGSAIVHGFLWLIYGYVARPTAEQLERIGEKVQQKMAIARGNVINFNARNTANHEASADQAMPERSLGKSINDFLHAPRTAQANPPAVDTVTVTPESMIDTVVAASDSDPSENDHNRGSISSQPQAKLQINFYDPNHLLTHLAPELAKPYLQLCEELLTRAADSLFNADNSLINRYVTNVSVTNLPKFSKHGAIVQLTGKAEQLPLASVLLAKLFIILNQVVYEKHRELARFSLPVTAGASLSPQFDGVQKLVANHGKEDGLILLYPHALLKRLNSQVELKNLPRPTTVIEREMVAYTGLSEVLMKELINKRDEILTLV